MDNNVANHDVADGNGHLEHILAAIEVENIDVDNALVFGIVGNPDAGGILYGNAVHAHSNCIVSARTKIKIETLHSIILLLICSFIC